MNDSKKITRKNFKRVAPGSYFTELPDKRKVAIYQTACRGLSGGRCIGWNLQIDGKTVSDWLPSMASCISSFNRNF